MKSATLILFVSTLFLHSCTYLLGIDKHYEYASQKQVDRFAERKMKIGGYKQLYFDSLALDTAGKIPFKPRLSNPIPQFKMFDNKTGKEICAWGICEGPAFLFHVYRNFPPRNINPIDTNTVLADCCKYLRNKDYSKHELQLDGYDYTIYAYWISAVGSPCKSMGKKLKRYVRRHRDKRIQLIFVNMDSIN